VVHWDWIGTPKGLTSYTLQIKKKPNLGKGVNLTWGIRIIGGGFLARGQIGDGIGGRFWGGIIPPHIFRNLINLTYLAGILGNLLGLVLKPPKILLENFFPLMGVSPLGEIYLSFWNLFFNQKD